MVGAPPQPGAPQQGPGGTEIPPCWGARLTWEGGGISRPVTHCPPKSCIPKRAKTTMKRKRRKRRLMMDFMEFRRETTRFLSEAQYLPGQSQAAGAVGGPGPWGDKGMRRDMGVMRGHRDSEGTRDGNSAPRHPTMAPCIHTCLLVLALPLRSQTHRHGQTNRQTDRRMDRAAVPNPSALTL